MKKSILFAMLAVFVFSMSACGKPKLTEEARAAEAVTLTLYVQGVGLSDDEFKSYFQEPLKKTHPSLTLKLVRSGQQKLDSLIAAGTYPDLIFSSTRSMGPFFDNNLPWNLLPLVKKYNSDLTKYDQVALGAIRNYGGRGQLYGLPVFVNFSAMFYNKDLFDKFETPYPKDGMSWEDIIELAKRTTYLDEKSKKVKIQYRGLNPDGIRNFSSSLSLPVVDFRTEKAAMLTDGWIRVFNLYKEIMDIPGNSGGNAKKLFEDDQTLAMYPGYVGRLNELEALYKKKKGINFDVSSYPYFKGMAGTGAEIDAQLLMITNQSKHKEDAYQVMLSVMNPEVQLEATRKARLTALDDQTIKREFGTDLKSLEGKNVYGMLKSIPSIGPVHTRFDNVAYSKLGAAANQAVKGISSVETALRQLQDDINAEIDNEKGIASSSEVNTDDTQPQ